MMMMIVLGILFLSSIQPIMMVISLIFITLFYSLVIFKIMMNYWFGYMLILVMLSGVLVVFTYMVSLSPNESFEVYMLIFIMIFMMLFYKMLFINYMKDYSFISLNLWVSYIGIFNLFLVLFLLSIMIMVVWLSSIKEGAVRVF